MVFGRTGFTPGDKEELDPSVQVRLYKISETPGTRFSFFNRFVCRYDSSCVLFQGLRGAYLESSTKSRKQEEQREDLQLLQF